MDLKALAAANLKAIMESELYDSVPITVSDPDGLVNSDDLRGITNDIGQMINEETGAVISGRNASVGINIGSLIDNGLGIPEGVNDKSKKPWLVTFIDIYSKSYTFKIVSTMPDRTLGIVLCKLGAWE